MKYFTINEFIKSDIATRLKIDNTPDAIQEEHIIEFIEKLLDPLREDWSAYCNNNGLGSGAIRVTSGFRNEVLNKAVGGSKTSAHYYGYAADLIPCNWELLKFKYFVWEWLKDKDFDQMISEDEDENNIPGWIHLGYKRGNGDQRHQYLYMKGDNYFYL